MLLTKLPIAPFCVVLLSSIVAPGEVLQHIPIDNKGEVPSSITMPPDTAVVYEMAVIEVVVILGGTGLSFLQEYT
jgi:hypothetical protein